jgi:hypothetical protein
MLAVDAERDAQAMDVVLDTRPLEAEGNTDRSSLVGEGRDPWAALSISPLGASYSQH